MLVKTSLVIEDKHFYEHNGINMFSISRVFLVKIIAGHTIQGGSSLIQKLVKNLFLTNTRSILRKINEMYMALILDWCYTKDRILEVYLNEFYLKQDGDEKIREFPFVSIYYFGRLINKLTLEHYSLLIGMLKGPSLYSPWSYLSSGLKRRNIVLFSLYNQKYIIEEIYRYLYKRSLNIQIKGNITSSYPSFIELVNSELKRKSKNKIENYSSTKIFTTFDSMSQNTIEKTVKIEVLILKRKKISTDLEVVMIVINRFTGEIQALIGNSKSKFNSYNRALKAYQFIGSLSKPIIYLTALSQSNKYNLNTCIFNYSISIKLDNGKYWTPENNNYHFNEKVMLLDALIYSINIPIVNLSLDISLNTLVNNWLNLVILKNKLLISFPSIYLGTIDLTLIEIAQMFQIIASGGYKLLLSSVRSVTSNDRKVLYRILTESEHIESSEASSLTLYVMQQV